MTDILMVCIDSTAGVMNGLCEAINNNTPYKARFVRVKDNWLKYPEDLTFDDQEELKSILEECSVIHWNIYDPSSYQKYFNFTPYLKDKIQVRHFHGSILRRNHEKIIKPDRYKKYFVSSPDLTLYCPEAFYLPNPIYIPYSGLVCKENNNWDILHMPTNQYPLRRYLKFVKHPEYYAKDYPLSSCIKGSDVFIKAVSDLQDKGEEINYVRPNRMTFKESLEYKTDKAAIFDQLWVGYYGCNSIEMMAMGKPAICYLSDYNKLKMMEWYNDEPRIMEVDHKNIAEQLKEYIKVFPYEYGLPAMRWAWKFHDPKLIAHRYCEEVYS